MKTPRLRSQGGFSMVELVVVVGLILVIMAGVIMVMPGAIRDARADGGMKTVVAQLRLAKEMAITQRRDMEVRFVLPREIQIWRQEVPAALGQTLVGSTQLENNVEFRLTPGVPDTPDGFGSTAAVEFDNAAALFFRSEGMFTDANPNLDPLNGTVFLGVPGQALMARAVTVFGPTALVRSFRWTGTQWVE
jgi:type II secretory pathway pseudopilin PulG